MGVTFWLETDAGPVHGTLSPRKSFCEAVGANTGDHEPDAELSGLAALLGIELEPILLVTGGESGVADANLPEDMPEDERRKILESCAASDAWAARCWQDARQFAAYLDEWEARLTPLLPPEPAEDLTKVEYYPIVWSADLDALGVLVFDTLERGATRLRMRADY
ncbi:MAG TPA: hypothetical protein VGE07_06960 [Herpetosiphonaceae bacterium]